MAPPKKYKTDEERLEAIKASKRLYSKTHRETLNKAAARYREKHKEKVKEQKRVYAREYYRRKKREKLSSAPVEEKETSPVPTVINFF